MGKCNKALETCKSETLENNPKTLTSPPLLVFPLVYETPIVKSNNDTARDTYRSLEVKVNLLNIEVIAMKSFRNYQMLILRELIKDSTLEKALCDHKTEIGRGTAKYEINICETLKITQQITRK